MSKTKSIERLVRPLAKTVLAKLIQIGEPARSIYAERLRELKPNVREALQLLSGWEGRRAELALTQPLSESERKSPKTLKEKAAALARQAMTPLSEPKSRNRKRPRQAKPESDRSDLASASENECAHRQELRH
jgi:hypothetical protein